MGRLRKLFFFCVCDADCFIDRFLYFLEKKALTQIVRVLFECFELCFVQGLWRLVYVDGTMAWLLVSFMKPYEDSVRILSKEDTDAIFVNKLYMVVRLV